MREYSERVLRDLVISYPDETRHLVCKFTRNSRRQEIFLKRVKDRTRILRNCKKNGGSERKEKKGKMGVMWMVNGSDLATQACWSRVNNMTWSTMRKNKVNRPKSHALNYFGNFLMNST